MIGAPDDLHPADWVWRFPGGGQLFLHAGDNIHAFYSGFVGGPNPACETPNLIHDILRAIVA